jgi:heme A synthase
MVIVLAANACCFNLGENLSPPHCCYKRELKINVKSYAKFGHWPNERSDFLDTLTEIMARFLGVAIGLVIAVPPILWAMRRDMENRLKLPKGALKRSNRKEL